MNAYDPTLRLPGITSLPRWLVTLGISLSAGCILAGFGMLAYAASWAQGPGVGGLYGGAFGCVIGGAGGLFGTLMDVRRGVPAAALLLRARHDEVAPLFRVTFWPAVVVLVASGALWLWLEMPALARGLAQPSGILAAIGGAIEAARRHTATQAKAALRAYAAGELSPDKTAVIERARAVDAAFDAGLREYLGQSSENASSAASRGRSDSA